MFSSSRRKIGVLLLAAVLVAPWAAAAEPGARMDEQGTRAPWDVLARFWSTLTAFWGESGCSVDPYGGCRDETNTTLAPPENLDNGCSVDPFGGCRGGS